MKALKCQTLGTLQLHIIIICLYRTWRSIIIHLLKRQQEHKQYSEAEFSYCATVINVLHGNFAVHVQCISSSVESVCYCLMHAILYIHCTYINLRTLRYHVQVNCKDNWE